MHPKSFVGRAPPGPDGELTALPQTLDLRGPSSKEGEGKGWKGEGSGGKWRGGKGTGGEGSEGKGRRSGLPPTHNFWLLRALLGWTIRVETAYEIR